MASTLEFIFAFVTISFPTLLYPYLVLRYLLYFKKVWQVPLKKLSAREEMGFIAIICLSSFAGFTIGHVMAWILGFYDPIEVLLVLRLGAIIGLIQIIPLILEFIKGRRLQKKEKKV